MLMLHPSKYFGGLLSIGLCGTLSVQAQQTAVPVQNASIEKDFVKDAGFKYGVWRSSVLGGGGYIQNVVPCPSNPNRYYTYVDVGGLYRSDDGGRKWKMLHGNLPSSLSSYEVRGVLVDPRDDKKIIIATGSQWAGKEGIFLSDDGGQTFRKTLSALFLGNGGNRAGGFILSRNSQNPDIVVTASVSDGIWKSEDNGQTWKASGGKDLYPSDIRFDRTNARRLWLSASGGKVGEREFKAGFWRSDDGGATWSALADSPPSEIVQDPKDAGIIYGIFNSALIKRSRDGGTTWEDFSDGLDIEPLKAGEGKPSISSTAYRALAAGPDFIVTGTTSNAVFFKLKSGESKWQKIAKEKVEVGDWYGPAKGGWFFGGAMGSISISPHDPNHWFITDFFAIYQTRDGGKNWRLTIDGIEVTVSHNLVQDPSDPAIVHLGQADIGPATSVDGGRRFHKNSVPDDKDAPAGGKNMKSMDLSPKLPNRLYGVGDKSYYVGWLSNQIYVSLDRGRTWRRSPMVGLPDMSKRACTTIVADLNDPYTVYVTIAGEIAPNGGGVYKSVDGGARWTAMNAGLPAGKYFFPYDIWAHGRQLAAGTDGSLIALSQQSNFVYRFDPKTQQWSSIDLKHKGKLWSVVADRLKPGRFFIGARSDGLYRTDDSGLTWKKVYDKSVSFVATDSVVSNRVAGGTLDGVVLSTDGGETWRELDKSLPYRHDNIPVFVGERLLVGSAGSGVFWMPLSTAGEKEITAKPMVVAEVPSEPGGLPSLVNMSLTEGGETPTGWSLWAPEGKLQLRRDTKVFRGGPASLSLASEGGAAYGTVSQEFKPTPGLWTIGGFTRGRGNLKEALVAIQSFDAANKQIAWTNLQSIQTHNKWWDGFSQTVSLLTEAASCRLVVVLKGDGQVWLDDLKVSKPEPLFLP